MQSPNAPRHTSRAARGAVATAAILALLGTATACSSGSDSSSDKGGPGNVDVAQGGKDFGVADAATAKLGSNAKPGVFPRTITQSEGMTKIPAKPKRVVVLDTGELDDVVSLGITPVGIPSTDGESSVPSYLKDKVKSAKPIGTISEPNLEAIAALKPDLILGSKLRADKLYKQLSQIAPTVFSIRPGYPWKENFNLVADSLGEETKGAQVMQTYQQNVSALKSKTTGNPTISLVRFMPGKLRLYANKSLIGVILQDAGLARPKVQDINDLAVEISPEKISQANGDYIFYTSYGKPGATGETKVISGSQWKNLPAVKAGKASRVNDDIWFLGLGPTGAGLIVKQLGEHLSAK